MDKETKAQAIYADMVRQAGDAIEELEELVDSIYECMMPEEGKLALFRAIKTLETLTAFIQGIQATQGLIQSQACVSQKIGDKITNCTCYMNSFGTICLWCQEQEQEDGMVKSILHKEAKDPLCTCIKNAARYGDAQEFIICDHCAEKAVIQSLTKPVSQQDSKEVYEKMYGPKLSPYHSISGCNCSACAAKRNIEETQGEEEATIELEGKTTFYHTTIHNPEHAMKEGCLCNACTVEGIRRDKANTETTTKEVYSSKLDAQVLVHYEQEIKE